jgi:hypothetical protein
LTTTSTSTPSRIWQSRGCNHEQLDKWSLLRTRLVTTDSIVVPVRVGSDQVVENNRYANAAMKTIWFMKMGPAHGMRVA